MLTADGFRADSIKKAARRSAWYLEDGEKVFLPNPFGRVKNNSRRRPHDVEYGLQHTASESLAASPIEERRRSGYQEAQRGFEAPPKADTFPEGIMKRDEVSRELPQDTESPITSVDADKEISSDTSPSKGDTGFVDASVGANEGPRKRKRRKFPFFKKSEDNGEGNGDDAADRTDSSDSQKKNKGPKITVMSQLRVVFLSWVNILLLAVPAGIALGNTDVNGVIVFVVNFIAIIPLAGMLSFATEELALYIGETLGGLLNATFGNAVELIVSIIALVQKKVLIVQTSLIGSMLSNLLLVLGMCFFFGGLRRTEQFFNVTVAQTAASLLALAIGSLIIPTAFGKFGTKDGTPEISRGTSVLLLVTYACYLIFQLRTHADMYNEPSQKAPKKPSKRKEAGEANRRIAAIGAGTAAASAGGEINRENLMHHEEADEEETPQLTKIGALLTLLGSTVLVAVCAEYMVDGIDAVAKSVSQEFIGLILLPIVGNAAEHATAVTVAVKDKMDLAIGVAIGSSLQIALLVLPLMVLLNWWGVGSGANPIMTLDFDGFLVSVLFISIILVNYLIQDGKSHWLEGALLQVTYLIIAVSAWFYPAKGDVAG